MPADADLLCEYFLSSQLSNSNKSSSSSVKTASLATTTTTHSSQNGHQHHHHHHNHTNGSTHTSLTFETIDFVKYNKNPMSDALKLKYEVLNNNNHHHNNNSSTTATTNGSTNTLNNHSLTQSISTAGSALVNGLNKSQIVNNKPVENGVGKVQTSVTVATTNGVAKVTTPALDLTWSRIRTKGIGLLNLGNNCYLNATLQCLAYTPPLSQWLVTRPHSPQCRFRVLKGFCSLCEVERIIFDIFNSAYGCAKPNSLCYNIKKISNLFGVGTQEDASEFFTTLLEHMAKAIKFSSSSSPNQFNGAVNGKHNANNKRSHTILDDIFAFQFRSRITCSSCGRVSDTIEDTNIWPLEVKYVQDIRKGMLHFLKEEILDGENAYKCEKCGRKTRATKKYSIRSAPNILVVHLKRFDSSHVGKLSHYVAYPETLQLPGLVNNNNSMGLEGGGGGGGGVQYKLYGVLVHLGYTSHSGHYYSYVRGPPHGQQWYKADDTSVSAVSASDALAQNAYILFYSKVAPPPSSTPTIPTPSSNSLSTSTSSSLSASSTPSTLNQHHNHVSLHFNHHNSSLTNGTKLLNGNSNGPTSTPTPSTSKYFNSIFAAPRIIKSDDTGPSPAKSARLEYGPQLPPTFSQQTATSTPTTNGNSAILNALKSNTISSLSAKKETSTVVTTNGHHHQNHDNHHNHYHHNHDDEEKQPDAKEEKKESSLTKSTKSSSSKKKLRRKRLKKLLRQLRNGRLAPEDLTEKQMKLAKTKKEKKRLKKVLKRKSSN